MAVVYLEEVLFLALACLIISDGVELVWDVQRHC